MENVVLFKVSSQGLNITFYGKPGEDQEWVISVEMNAIEFPDDPTSIELLELEQEREYMKTEFEFSLEDAFRSIDETDWHLCRPEIIHPDIAERTLERFTFRMTEYNELNPPVTAMDQFIRDSRVKEWYEKTGGSQQN